MSFSGERVFHTHKIKKCFGNHFPFFLRAFKAENGYKLSLQEQLLARPIICLVTQLDDVIVMHGGPNYAFHSLSFLRTQQLCFIVLNNSRIRIWCFETVLLQSHLALVPWGSWRTKQLYSQVTNWPKEKLVLCCDPLFFFSSFLFLNLPMSSQLELNYYRPRT